MRSILHAEVNNPFHKGNLRSVIGKLLTYNNQKKVYLEIYMYIKKKYFINISIAAIITTSPNLALAELTSQQMDSIFECTSLLASSMNQSLNYELEFAGDDPEFNEASLQIFDKWQGFMMNFQDISESQNAAVEKHIEYLSESVPADRLPHS